MKTILIIILALFTLSSCKFSYDKAKVEESYGGGGDSGGYSGGESGGYSGGESGGFSGGEGGGDSGGGGGCPTPDPDPNYSTLTADLPSVSANGTDNSIDDEDKVTLTYTLLDCNQLPISGVTPTFDATNTSSLNIPENSNCSVSDLNGVSTCTLSSGFAEPKIITTTSPASISALTTTVGFTTPPLTLNLTACLAANSSPMSAGLSLPFVSPFSSSVKPHKFLSTFPNYFTNNEAPQPYIPPATAVDWVLIQLYDASTGASVDAKSGFIHTNGSILDPSGNPISFSTSISPTLGHNYNINIIHRNHLSIGLYNPVNNASGSLTIDLTSPGTEYLGETPAGAPVASPTEDPYVIIGGLKCLRPGDFNQDFKVDTTDRSNLVTYLFGASGIIPGFNYSGSMISIPGYYNSDITLNGSSYIYDPAPVADWAEDVQVINNSIMTGTTKPIWGNGLTVP